MPRRIDKDTYPTTESINMNNENTDAKAEGPSVATFPFARLPLALALIGGLALAGGCGESTTEAEEEEEEHAEPEGAVLTYGAFGTGQVVSTYDGDDQSWSDTLRVEAEMETARIVVTFVDHDGDAVELEENTHLDVLSSDSTIASFRQDVPGDWNGHVVGNAAGETGMSFRLMHGAVGAGHPDFATMPAPVVVRARGQS